MGMDSDHPLAAGEVGRVGVAICSLADMQRLFEGIQLAGITTSMTINSTAAILLCFYVLVARSQGADLAKISGTIQNDILKEYIARGTYIYPPRPAMRIITDLFAWAARELPEWNTISISGYHIREAGSTAIQEVAFTLANAIAYISAAIDAGLDVDSFAPRLSFFFNSHSNFLEEIAKFRAARRLYAKIMRDRFGARNPRSMMLRFHVQTAGSSLTAQQPDVNVVRVSMQALGGGAGRRAIPAHQRQGRSARPSHRRIRASGSAHPADHRARNRRHQHGRSLRRQLSTSNSSPTKSSAAPKNTSSVSTPWAARWPPSKTGFVQNEIQNAAYAYQQTVERGEAVVVGVNKFQQDTSDPPATFRLDPELEKQQIARLRDLRASRDARAVDTSLSALESAARSTDNLMPHIMACAEAYATVGEISDRSALGFRRIPRGLAAARALFHAPSSKSRIASGFARARFTRMYGYSR